MLIMKSLGLHRLSKKAAVFQLLFHQEIHTSNGLLRRMRSKLPGINAHESRARMRNYKLEEDEYLQKNPEDQEDEDKYEDLDFMNVDKAYDDHIREEKRIRYKLGQIITKKKFFASRPQPQMLTYQERECIKYLHKQDPVQWNVKTLSESFPATPEIISKVIRSKRKITPEKAERLDSIVQRNWKFLEEGKLIADSQLIEHLKKFVNRREVLLNQIKNEKIYLPEIKKEPVWNNGEFSNILKDYEKKVKQLAETADGKQRTQLIEDKISEEKRNKGTSAVEYLHEKITKIGARQQFKKDSFMVGEMVNAYSNQKTLEEVENQILQKAEAKKPLHLFEKAILETKLGVPSQKKFEELPESRLPTSRKIEEKVTQNINDRHDSYASEKQTKKVKNRVDKQEFIESGRWQRDAHSVQTNSEMFVNEQEEVNIMKTNERTQIVKEGDFGKLLSKIHNVSQPKEEEPKKEKKVKPQNLDPESLDLENSFYDREVEHIKNTSFWNNNRSSVEKAFAETQKPRIDGLARYSQATNPANFPVFSDDAYPERIKIPKEHRGSGLTFRIKDCYYDDDGTFLYRVPGMIKT